MKHLVLIFLPFSLLIGCAGGDESNVANNPENGVILNFDVNQYKLNQLACDPLNDGAQPGPNDGMIATLHYRRQNQQRFYDVMSYIDQGQQSSQTLFFSHLNVPTRTFNLGFPTEAGSLIQNDAQEDLIEYFALKINSILKLAPDDEEGEYELALLSDDGALFKIRDEEGTYQVVVENDGDHPTRMGCGQTISMARDTELVVEIDYYQGPRYHISLIPMWRKVDTSTPAEVRCGQKGNSLFFDFNNNSAPQAAYTELLSRGWKPIEADNWHLPAFANFNPCTQGEPPVITNLAYEVVEGFVIFSWQTDKPATSQLLYSETGSSEQLMTEADNRLRIIHRVVINPGVLTPGTDYDFQAVSISDTYGKTMSDIVQINY